MNRSAEKGVFVDVQVEAEEDSDDYDPSQEESSIDDGSQQYCDNDYEKLGDDDTLFDANTDKDVEFASLETAGGSMAGLEGTDTDINACSDDFSSDELRSIDDSSDEENLTKKNKHPVFNAEIDMLNPVFKVGM